MVGRTVHLDVTVNGRSVPGAVVDSGSERTLLSRPTADMCRLKLRPSRKAVVGAGRESLHVHGAADVVLHVPGTAGEVTMEVLVTECSDDLLLGTDFLKAAEVAINFSTGALSCFGQEVGEQAATVCRCVVMGGAMEDSEDSLEEEVMTFLDQAEEQADLSHLPAEDQRKLKAVLDQSDVFSAKGQLGRVTAVEHRIELLEEPRKKKPYPVPPALRETANRQIADMLSMGVIRECTSPYASPVLLVKKKGSSEGTDSYRVCTDFRELNRCTVKDSFPLPRIESLLASIGPRSRVFSQLDQKTAC